MDVEIENLFLFKLGVRLDLHLSYDQNLCMHSMTYVSKYFHVVHNFFLIFFAQTHSKIAFHGLPI